MKEPAAKMEFRVSAKRLDAHGALAACKDASITLDTDLAGRRDAFNPAELVLAALAACMIKGIERVTPILKFNLRGVDIRLHGVRQDVPPKMGSIDYEIVVDTDESDARLDLLHENVKKYGTVFNTVAPGTQLSGRLVMGNVIQAGVKMNPARQAGIGAGLPVTVPALTVNRVCGSGAQGVVSVALEISADMIDCAIAGGMENMDRAPYLMPQARWGARMGDITVYDSMLYDGLNDAFSGQHSGWHTEDLVVKNNVSRADQDRWALRSQQRFSAAQAVGKFAAEIVPFEVPGRKGPTLFDKDEHNRPDTTAERLAKLKPAFRKGGTITAGNAPSLNTGAAAIIVAERGWAEKNGLKPMAKLVSYGIGAVEPGFFGLGPVPAVRQARERAGRKVGDVERIEINEAFAAIALACLRELGFSEDIVNVEGGAIAHGHPIGASGTVLATRLMHSMRRDGLKRGIVTLCIGGGQDHRWLGNAYFHAKGIRILAHENTARDIQERGRAALQGMHGILKERFESTSIQLPTRLFKTRERIEMGDTLIEIVFSGGAHTPGDSIVWLPVQWVALSGDIVYVQRALGVLPMSNIKNWLAAFDLLAGLKPEVVVPGHGNPTTIAEAARDTRDYLRLLRTHMKQAVDKGTDIQDAIRSLDDHSFARLLNFSELRGGNASRAYLEAESE